MAQFGSAGGGLGGDDARARFGQNAIIGAAGERYFADALRAQGITSSYTVWASLSIPDDRSNPRATRYSSDVDFAVASGEQLILIDVKRWAGGVAYWSLPLLGLPMKGLAPMMKSGTDWRLSANMAAAVSRYQARLPGVAVSAMVIFVPTNRAGRMPTSVGFLRWPGGIHSFLAQDGINALKRRLGTPRRASPAIQALCTSLLRGGRR